MCTYEYVKCPLCNGKKSVRIYNIMDYTLYRSGNIITEINGICLACGMTFKVNHGT